MIQAELRPRFFVLRQGSVYFKNLSKNPLKRRIKLLYLLYNINISRKGLTNDKCCGIIVTTKKNALNLIEIQGADEHLVILYSSVYSIPYFYGFVKMPSYLLIQMKGE